MGSRDNKFECYGMKDGVSELYLRNVLFMMHSEHLLFDAQSRTHFRERPGNQAKPRLFVTHGPQDLAVTLYTPPIMNMYTEFDLLLSICFCQAWANPLSIHAEVRLRLQPVEDRLG
jgi:hypothetical protein